MVDMSQAILDSLTDQVALIDHQGTILFVNKAWIRFSDENFQDVCSNYIGLNYLHVCQENVKAGIVSVLEGKCSIYTFEYPCHSQKHLRWFLLRVTPLVVEGGELCGAVISHINITDRKLAELSLTRKEEHYRLITEHSTDFISLHTRDGCFTFASPICKNILGYEIEELLDHSIYIFLHPEDQAELQGFLKVAQFQTEIQTITYRIYRKDGSYVWFETKLKCLFTTEYQRDEFIFISRDITEQKNKMLELQAETKALKQKIYTDELTGVYNRRLLNLIVEKHIQEFQLHHQPFSLLMLDIDYFKQFNDTYGHVAGDRCLRRVAMSIKNDLGHQDFIFRVGGEEFCVLLPNTTEQEAAVIANRIRQTVESLNIPHTLSQISPYITVSLGIYTVMQHEQQLTIGALLERADRALYKAKENGRNQTRIYS